MFAILYIAVTRGLITDIESMPLLGALIGKSDIEKCKMPDEPVDLDLKSLKEANKALESLRQKVGGGSLLVVGSILANPISFKLGLGLQRLAEPVENKSLQTLKTLGTKTGCHDWNIEMALGGHDTTLLAVFNVLSDPTFLSEVGFLNKSDVQSEILLREEHCIAEAFVQFSRNLVAKEILSSSMFTWRPPLAFLPYLKGGESKTMVMEQLGCSLTNILLCCSL